MHRVSLPQFRLDGDDKVCAGLGRSKNDGRGTNPKAALDGKPRAARHGGDGLGDGAAELESRTAAECRAAAGNHAAREGETAAALGQH